MKIWSVVLIGILVTGGAWAGPFDNAVGTWQGQAEYLAKVNAVADDASHAVAELTIKVESGGRISGSSPENGCQLLGVVKPFVTPQNYTVQATLGNCRAANLNGRYQGPLTVKPNNGTLELSLTMSSPGMLGRPARWGAVAVTMVRR